MRVRLLLFGPAAELLGPIHDAFELRDGAQAGEVAGALVAARPEAAAHVARVAVAVNKSYVRPERPLMDGDEVALIPPVSGG